MISLHIHLAEYKPFNDRSYIKLPDSFQRKKAVLNIKNKDNNCFQWCIARVLKSTRADFRLERKDKPSEFHRH